MVEDAKMTDAEESKKIEEKTEEKEVKTPPKAPLEAAGLRLERLLGGSKAAEEASSASSSSSPSFYTNPAKIVRRWLTTSSGTAGSATLEDIGSAAVKLLKPCPEILSSFKKEEVEAMDTGTEDVASDAKPDEETTFLTVAARPFEAWLISLAVRCLHKSAEYDKAYALAQVGIEMVSAQFEDSRIVSSVVSAFYPLLARLIRWRSLVVEHMPTSVVAALRPQMAQAYNLASLRRDADTQATLLNCMLRDLLRSSQSKCPIVTDVKPCCLDFVFVLS